MVGFEPSAGLCDLSCHYNVLMCVSELLSRGCEAVFSLSSEVMNP